MKKYKYAEEKGKFNFFFYVYPSLHEMMLSIADSKHNKPTLKLDASRYIQNQIWNTTVYWKCENRTWCGGWMWMFSSLHWHSLSPHILATDILSSLKNLFANRNIIVYKLNERLKQQTWALNKYLE